MDWIKKYKLYHIPFWALYHYGWWSVYTGDPGLVASDILQTPMVIKYLAYVLIQAIGVYFSLYFLIPRLLERGRLLAFLLSLGGTILVVATLIVGGYFLSAALAGLNPYELFQVDPPSPLTLFKRNTLPSSLSVFTLALSIKLAKSWLQAKQRNHQIEQEKLQTELKFLRSQFNPHFLFNTINSVFVLIDKNPVMASETLTRFSDLLRYQLYECNAPKIPLSKELDYLRSYLELEEIRLNDDYEIKLFIDEASPDLVIAPFVLMPFLENAFKHVSHRPHHANWINVSIQIKDNQLKLAISNSISSTFVSTETGDDYQGIGLSNVKRRLDLLYPHSHRLEIVEDEDSFSVFLNLQLERQSRKKPITS